MPEDAVMDALRVARDRQILPTTMGTAGLRELAADVRRRAVFTARGTNAQFLSVLKEVIDRLAAGDISMADARVILGEALRALGYTPEGGFPGDMGKVPPAIKGTIQDLTSFRRLDLIVRTQDALMAGAGQQLRGHAAARLAAFPAWELIRTAFRRMPRNYAGSGNPKESPRWIVAGGRLFGGRMIAPKGDPVWGELGGSGNFEDALDVDHPPFYFNSGMSWREVSAAECKALGVTASDGTPLDDFLASQPVTLAGRLPVPAGRRALGGAKPAHAPAAGLPSPRMSTGRMDPALATAFERTAGGRPEAGQPGVVRYDDLIARDLARKAARKGGAP